MFFRSSHDAEAYLEPVDIRNEEYVGYDASGKRLRIEIVKVRRPVFFGHGSCDVEGAKLSMEKDVSIEESRLSLERALVRFLREQDIPLQISTSDKLQALIAVCITRCGYTN